MAKKLAFTLVDDFDGAGAADETVGFGLDGVTLRSIFRVRMRPNCATT